MTFPPSQLQTVKCRRCPAQVVFLKTNSGRLMPVDAAGVTPGETVFDHTRHVSHFATCPEAPHFRRKQR